jgi:hypothetical protein
VATGREASVAATRAAPFRKSGKGDVKTVTVSFDAMCDSPADAALDAGRDKHPTFASDVCPNE